MSGLLCCDVGRACEGMGLWLSGRHLSYKLAVPTDWDINEDSIHILSWRGGWGLWTSGRHMD